METKIKDRVIKEARLFLEEKSTIREVAKRVGMSKSTVHKDLKEKLVLIDKNLYFEVLVLLNFNKNIRHLRGGEATKKIFLRRNESKNDWSQNLRLFLFFELFEKLIEEYWKSDLKRKKRAKQGMYLLFLNCFGIFRCDFNLYLVFCHRNQIFINFFKIFFWKFIN